MREKQNQPFQLSFNAALKIDFQGSRVTSDGGLILVRELDERLGLGELIEQHLRDPRRGRTTWGTCGGVSSQPSALCALPGRNLAASWTKARRVVAKVEYHCGERSPGWGSSVLLVVGSSVILPSIRFLRSLGACWVLDAIQNAARHRAVVAWHQAGGQRARLLAAVLFIRWLGATAFSRSLKKVQIK
jgi:hypothetical protein